MNKFTIKGLAPYLISILIFLLITVIYFNPVLQGKRLFQDDISKHKGMSKEIMDFRKDTGEEALWTNSMFGGMPAYQISVKYKANLIQYIDDILQLGLPHPMGLVFLYFLGFFILMIVMRINPWLGAIGSIAFALSTYFFFILVAGHNSKAHAIAYMAPVIAGIILTYRGKLIWGSILTALFLALEIQCGHPQITYYLLLIVVILGIFELVNSIKENKLTYFLKATGLMIIAAGIAVLTHSTNLWATYEYGKDTIRGESELSINEDQQTGGLDLDYATRWSVGVSETWTLMIPHAKGGGSRPIGDDNKALKESEPQFRSNVAGMLSYWGNQPIVYGPVYVGAIIVFLFILGLFIVPGRMKWVLLTATILSIFLSWGKNWMPFTEFFMNYIPGYNKFRAVSMTLVIAELCMPILGVLALNEIIKKPTIIKSKAKEFYIAFGFTGGLSLIFYLFPSLFFGFFSNEEIQQLADLRNSGGDPTTIERYIMSMEATRIAIFKADAIRSFIYILLAAGFIYLFGRNKLKAPVFLGLIGFIILFDLVGVNLRYLNKDNYERKSRVERPFQATIADQEIIKDTDIHYRVLNLTTNTFNETSTSYFHKSLGGYHGAKLRRYQELIELQIVPEMNSLIEVFNSNPDLVNINRALQTTSVLNMLNTKYIIVNPAGRPLSNYSSYGHCWFVDNIQWVENADEEMTKLDSVNLLDVALIDKRFKENVALDEIVPDSLSVIRLVSYKPNEMTYRYAASSPQFAVFSEIYYDKGWNAYLNGEILLPHVRVNYVLRGMELPAGENELVFKFEPRVYRIGEKVSLASSLLLILVVIGFATKEVLGRRKEE